MVGLSSGYSGTPQLMTRLTMALLEDSGWYSPRWHNAAVLSIADSAGCGFVTQTQAQFSAARPSSYLYCSTNGAGELQYSCALLWPAATHSMW
jgi:hypothetical protein